MANGLLGPERRDPDAMNLDPNVAVAGADMEAGMTDNFEQMTVDG